MGTMPTVLHSGPYRVFFYAGDGNEPPHVHVERDDCEAKFWLEPILLERSYGFSRKENRRIKHQGLGGTKSNLFVGEMA